MKDTKITYPTPITDNKNYKGSGKLPSSDIVDKVSIFSGVFQEVDRKKGKITAPIIAGSLLHLQYFL